MQFLIIFVWVFKSFLFQFH